MFDSVLSFADKGIKSYKTLNDSIYVAKCLLFKIRAYIMQEELEKADSIMINNFSLLKRLNSYEIVAGLIKSKKYFQLNQFKLALSSTEENYIRLNQLHSKEGSNLRLFFHKEIFLLFKDLGSYKNALEVYEIYSKELSENKNQQILREQ